jgi:competence protein ComEA
MKTLKLILSASLFLLSSICFAGPVNINNADMETLASLKGVGPAKAAAIIADRDANGPFTSIEDLLRVKGIGERTVEWNRDALTITDEAAAE